MPNRFVPIGANASLQEALAVINGNFAQLDSEAVTKSFKGPNQVNALISGKLPNGLGYGLQFSDDNNVPRIIAYIDANNQPVFKISQDGVDVNTATDDQLIFNSAQNILKVALTDTVTLSVDLDANFNSVQVAHGLGAVKAAIVYLIDYPSVGASQQLPITNYVFLGAPGSQTTAITELTNYEVNSTNLTINVDHPRGGGSGHVDYTFRYYILQETAAH